MTVQEWAGEAAWSLATATGGLSPLWVPEPSSAWWPLAGRRLGRSVGPVVWPRRN
jgi:hypothetical protein